jgi:hypothetical protein
MDKENVIYIYIYIYNGILFSHKEQNDAICRKAKESGNHYVKQNRPDSE